MGDLNAIYATRRLARLAQHRHAAKRHEHHCDGDGAGAVGPHAEFRVNTTPVASAASIDPPDGYLVHTISGTADIDTITAEAAGKVIVLLFSGDAATTGLITDSGNLQLESNLLYAPGDAIALLCNGTSWIEIGRNEAARAQATNDLGSVVDSKANLATLNASGLSYTNHGVTGTATRPADFEGALFVGSVTPTNAVDGDVWIDTT